MVTAAACTGPAEPPARTRASITGGDPTTGDPGVVPLTASVSLCGEEPQVLCTGTAIGPRAVVTAAHCVGDGAAAITVAGGPVAGIALEPDGADVAVLELAEPLAATAPEPLRQTAMGAAEVGAKVRLVGYGVDDDGAIGAKREGTATIDAVADDSFRIVPGPSLTCDGDSGGPVFLAGELAGVVSFGDPACTTTGTNLRVDVYAGFVSAAVDAIAAAPAPAPRPAFDPAVDYCETPCAGDDECPDGFACEGERCALAGGDVGVFEDTCADDSGCGDGLCVTAPDRSGCLCFLRCELREPDGCCSSGGGGGAGSLAVVLALAALRWRRRLALAALTALGMLACSGGDDPPAQVSFVDITAEVGLDTAIVLPDPADEPCPSPPCPVEGASFGVGGAAADVDGDGRVDLYLAGPDGGRLWGNRTPDGGAIALVEIGGLPPSSDYVHGAAFGDLDRDGDPDLVLATAAGPRLYTNDGAGAFTDASAALGVTRAVSRTTSVTLGDIDGDGNLDIHVSEYGAPYDPDSRGPGLLLMNRGELQFDDAATGWPARHGWSSLMADLDRDGRLDLLVAAETWEEDDPHPTTILWNDAGGLAADPAIEAQFERLTTPMGAAAGDVDGDGNLEVLVAMQGPSAFVSRPPGAGARALAVDSFFGPPSVLEAYQTNWGVALADVDRDGDLEAVMIGGAPCVPDHCDPIPPSQPGELFEFEDHVFDYAHAVRVDGAGGLAAGEGEYRNQRGLILADLGGDGRDELVTTPFNDRFHVYRLDAGAGHYLRVELRGTASAPTPVGAEVTVRAGDASLRRQLTAGGSTHSSHGPGLVFELGGAETYDGIDVRWPGGGEQSFPGGAADSAVVLIEGS